MASTILRGKSSKGEKQKKKKRGTISCGRKNRYTLKKNDLTFLSISLESERFLNT